MTFSARRVTGLAVAAGTALALVAPATGVSAAAASAREGSSPAAAASDPEYFASLRGSSYYNYRLARGWSEYERSSEGREVEVVLSNAPARLHNRWLTVYVNGRKAGRMYVDGRGHARLERDTEHGQYVPWATGGSPVRVRTSYNVLVVSGYYHRVYD
jgi:hypothetical protein